MEKQDAIGIITSRKLITEPGKYRLTVSTVQPFNETRGEGKAAINVIAIANFRAMSPFHVDSAKALLAEGKHQEACNNNFSLSLREGSYVPQKGEQVDAIIELVETKSGEKGLFVTSLIEVKAKTAMPTVSLGEEVAAEVAAAEAGAIG